VRSCFTGPHPPTSSGSAFPIKNGSEFSVGIIDDRFERDLFCKRPRFVPQMGFLFNNELPLLDMIVKLACTDILHGCSKVRWTVLMK